MGESKMVQTAAGLLVPASTQLRVGGVFEGQIIRAGRVIDTFRQPNLVVNEGLNHLLNVAFNSATQITTWYCGLFEGNYTPIATITAATITAAATECTAYDNATRVEYADVTSTAQSMTNAADRASFVMSAAKTIYGAFLISASAKSAVTGTLFAATRFTAPKVLEIDDELLLTYTVAASST